MEDSKREPAGILYGVGTGPGDPELLTLKAVRILREADVIGIPSTKKEGCKAWQIAVQAVPEIEKKETLFVSFPMSRDPAVLERAHQEGAMQTAKLLDQGKSIAFLTLGDPSVYSTYCYLQKQIRAGGSAPHSSWLLSFGGGAGIFGNPGADEIGETDRSRKRTAAGGKLLFQDGGKLRNAGGAGDPADRGYSGGRRILFADYCKG